MTDLIRTAFTISTAANLRLKVLAAEETAATGVRVTPSDLVQRLLDEHLTKDTRRGRRKAAA